MIHVITGPPCSGKSTRAATLGLRTLDWDVMYAEISGLPLHQRSTDATIARSVEAAYQMALADAAARGVDLVAIRAAPERRHRGMLRRLFDAQVTVLEVPTSECLRRLESSGRPAPVIATTRRSIVEWWRTYGPSPRDVVERWIATIETPADPAVAGGAR